MHTIKSWRFYLLFALLGIAAFYVYTRSEADVPISKPLASFPQKAGDWTMTGQARFDERVLAVLLPTDYLSRSYEDSKGHRLSIYIGFHNGGQKSGPIHSPKQCLPGSGWNRFEQGINKVSIGELSIPYVHAIYQKDTEKQLFLYWFQVRDAILTNEYALKLAMIKNSVLSNRRDSAFIRLSVMATDNEEQATQIGEQFIRDFYMAIQEALPR
ncbi:MAG: EpsI family protein [Desulfuromusa sp.]|nr:EpsI family protein [Desulfuromusa sp.]